ncbi:MAG TPA: acyl-CoA dehydrogenase family protein [Thermomicrobiales bacterium]|nr:acyl-CoA dehydrogenase family protein [Thermomicrobiales bacterium]
MDFDFSEDQVTLRNLVREFLTEQAPVSHVRAMMEDATGYARDTYREFVRLGITPFPEQYGGGGLGMVEQAIILEEMGRIPYPGPYFATIMAGAAIMHSSDENAAARYIPDVSAGDLTLTVAFLEDSLGWGPDTIGLPAGKTGDGYVLNGTKRFVAFGHTADVILVAARTGDSGADGVSLIAVPRDTAGLSIETNTMLDMTSKVATLTFDDVTVPAENLIGAEGGAWPALEMMLRYAAVGASAEMLGASRTSLEMSVDYAKVRKQFGQFIGQFQAVKHMLAEMLELVENAHAAVYYAAWAIDADAPDAAMAASVAKSTVNVAAREVCGNAIQVHGGIGYTWEYDLHLYFKRAKHLEPLYGDTDFHRERVLQEVLAGHVAGAAV